MDDDDRETSMTPVESAIYGSAFARKLIDWMKCPPTNVLSAKPEDAGATWEKYEAGGAVAAARAAADAVRCFRALRDRIGEQFFADGDLAVEFYRAAMDGAPSDE